MQALATSGGGGGITPDELRKTKLNTWKNPFEAVITEEKRHPNAKRKFYRNFQIY